MMTTTPKRSLAANPRIFWVGIAVFAAAGAVVYRLEIEGTTLATRSSSSAQRSRRFSSREEETFNKKYDDHQSVSRATMQRRDIPLRMGPPLKQTPVVLRSGGDKAGGFGCVRMENEEFVREMCLLDVKMSASDEYEGYEKMETRLTIRKKDKKNFGGATAKELDFEWSCGDAVRVSFETSDALFGPSNFPIFEERDEESGEIICGEFPIEAIVPREGEQYRGILAKVWLLHVNGEGLKDPEKERPFPENLMAKANKCPPCDGPRVYNIRRTFPWRVYVEKKDYFVRENEEEDIGVGENVLDDAAGFTKSYKNIKETESTHGWYKMEAYQELHENPANDLSWRREGAKIPFCKNGDGAGRWVFSKKMYRTQSEEDALEWRYYGCKIKHASGLKLNSCLERIGPVKFAGESTLGHVYEAFLQHLNKTEYFWPTRHDLDARKVYGRLDLIRAQGEHSDFHGIDMVNEKLFKEIEEHKRVENVQFENVVILQGANDAARYSIEKFREKMKTFVETVIKYRETSNNSERVRLKRLVWVTAPTRHYKSSSGPGDSMCPNGSSSESRRTCSAGNNGQAHTDAGATRWHGIESGTDANSPPNLFGTHERRQLLNQIAKKMLREKEKVLADEVYIVDYESLTAALPSDYNYDGEHWGCPWRSWENRRGSGYSCKGLANVVVSNIISHFLGCKSF